MISNTEGRLALAIEAFNSGQCKTLRAAAAFYDVPHATLYRRHAGALPQQETRPAACKLTLIEEEVLLQRILDLDDQGFPPQLALVRDTANILLANRGQQPAPTVGKNWVTNFVKRNPSL
jgi:hypothetical protein